MSTYTATLTGLSAGQLEDVERHLRQTYSMIYGMLERQEQLLFRVGIAETQRTETPAVFLRTLADQIHAGGPLKVMVPRAKQDQYRISELLRQSHTRAAREATGPYGQEAAAVLARMTREWDDQRRLSNDETERAEWISLPGTAAAAAEPVGRIVG